MKQMHKHILKKVLENIFLLLELLKRKYLKIKLLTLPSALLVAWDTHHACHLCCDAVATSKHSGRISVFC